MSYFKKVQGLREEMKGVILEFASKLDQDTVVPLPSVDTGDRELTAAINKEGLCLTDGNNKVVYEVDIDDLSMEELASVCDIITYL